jgi:hypothetical protein
VKIYIVLVNIRAASFIVFPFSYLEIGTVLVSILRRLFSMWPFRVAIFRRP